MCVFARARCGSGVVPVLLSEVSSPKTRGAVGSIHQLMINLGVLCSGLLGYSLVEDVPHGWRYVQGFIVVPAVAQVCDMHTSAFFVGPVRHVGKSCVAREVGVRSFGLDF